MISTDRSRIECFQACPRKRWWAYEYGGKGLERDVLALPLLTGSCVHRGIEVLLTPDERGHIGVGYQFEHLERAIAAALAEYDKQSARGIDELAIVGESNRALVEALIRVFASEMLPTFLDIYEVLKVEEEMETQIESLRLLSRLDALVRRRADGAVLVVNFKTVSSPDQWWSEGFLYDNQTVSEVLAAEASLGQRVDGVLIIGLVKGARKQKAVDEATGTEVWLNNSPLIWGWHNEDKNEWAATYEWTDEAGLNRRLGKGYRRQPVWRAYPGGVAGWFDFLRGHAPQVLGDSVVQLPAILRSDWQVAQWKHQTVAQEMRIAESSKVVNSASDTYARQAALDTLFPMFSAGGTCIRPSKCQFHALCWGGGSEEPLSNGYRWRTANHPQEFEVLK